MLFASLLFCAPALLLIIPLSSLLTVVLVTFALAFLVLIPMVYKALRLRRRIRQSRTLTGQTLARDGPAKLSGALSGPTLSAPVSRTPCVLWQVEVYDQRGRGRRPPIFQQTAGGPLMLRSGEVQAHIHTNHIELITSNELRAGHLLTGRPLTVGMRRRLHEHGMPELPHTSSKYLIVIERWIAPGEQVFVQGDVERPRLSRHLHGRRSRPLLLSNQSEERLDGQLRELLLAMMFLLVAIAALAMILPHVPSPPGRPVYERRGSSTGPALAISARGDYSLENNQAIARASPPQMG